MRTNTSPDPYVVIYEFTVYPGATEEDCVPVLEKHSGLKFARKPSWIGLLRPFHERRATLAAANPSLLPTVSCAPGAQSGWQVLPMNCRGRIGQLPKVEVQSEIHD